MKRVTFDPEICVNEVENWRQLNYEFTGEAMRSYGLNLEFKRMLGQMFFRSYCMLPNCRQNTFENESRNRSI